MHEPDFLSQLTALVDMPVIGLSRDAQLALIQAVCAERQRAIGAPLPACGIVPFVTGRRPTTEIAHPGLGSSDNTSLIWGVPGRDENWAYILYTVTGLERYTPEECAAFALDVTLSFAGSDGSLHTAPLPGWDKRPLVPVAFADGTHTHDEADGIGRHTRLVRCGDDRRVTERGRVDRVLVGEVRADQPSAFDRDRRGEQRRKSCGNYRVVSVEYGVEIAVSIGEQLPRSGERVGDFDVRQGHDSLEHHFEARRSIGVRVVSGQEQFGDHATRVGYEAHRVLPSHPECIHEYPGRW